tara:strand:+ start:2866 stop:4998 length:2133 start_codon:yes stop_codon:yes gene_type:complete
VIRLISSYALACFIYLSFSQALFSNIEEYYRYSVSPDSSNYGNTGLLEMPSARFMEEASLRLNFSSSFPNEYTALSASPFKWLEATYRYTEIKNRKYGPSNYSGNQSLKDKGFDVKIRLKKESENFPAVALGLRDLAGTGRFSSEYLVATKRYRNLDITLGLGWGLLGTSNSISNPLEAIDKSFLTRTNEAGEGGVFSYSSWFSGKTSIIGGLEYYLHKQGLKFTLEYDTTNPETYGFVPRVRSRLNFGLSYFPSDSLNFSAGFERGEEFRLSFNLTGNFFKDTIKKPRPKNVIRLSQNQLKRAEKNKQIFYNSLNKSLRDESIYIQAAELSENEVSVAVASSRFYSMTRAAGRTARIVSALSPESIDRMNIHSMNGDFEVAIFSLDRKEFDSANNKTGSSNELLNKSKMFSDSSNPIYKTAEYQPKVNFPEFEWSMSPSLKHQIGGPEGFYLGQLYWRTDTSIKFRRNLALYTTFGINIYDTFNDFNNPSQSTIPRVRSDIQNYLEEGKNNIQRMQLEYFSSPWKDVFFRADFGLLEEMFAGVGGEILYRPFNRKVAFGFSAHRVRQRDYDQRFNLRDYETTTGHAGIYFDLPSDVKSQILIGKYLAGDKGITLDLSRRFKTGFTLGVFASKTNLSAEEFGEGSFDKGFYISVPTKLFYTDYRTGHISFGLHPLTKDGASMLNQHHSLFSILGDTSKDSINRDWLYLLN